MKYWKFECRTTFQGRYPDTSGQAWKPVLLPVLFPKNQLRWV